MAKSPKDDIKYLEKKLKRNPNSILFARLADAYASIERIDDAIQICENGLRKHPYYVTGHFIISKCYLKKKQFDHAEKELKRVLLFDPEYIAAHRDYGELMSQIGWNSSCERSYEKIQAIDPFNKQAKEKIRQIKESLKLDEDAEKEFDVDLDEFEEEAMVADQQEQYQSEEPEEHKKPEQQESPMETSSTENNDYDNFDELFTDDDEISNEDSQTKPEDSVNESYEFDEESLTENSLPEELDEDDEETISKEEESEKFNYILDDIFREDNIKSEPSEDYDSEDFDKSVPTEKQENDQEEEDEEADLSQFTLDEIDRLTADEMDDQETPEPDEEEEQESENDIRSDRNSSHEQPGIWPEQQYPCRDGRTKLQKRKHRDPYDLRKRPHMQQAA